MDFGWEASAAAWIAEVGERGDFGRRYVLDPVMLPRALARSPANALDIGCGEGRFCRLLKRHGVESTGVDPTRALISAARTRDASGAYVQAQAERLPFRDETYDLVVSYLSFIDIPDVEAAIAEIARVLKSGGTLLIANLTSFNTAGADIGWVKDSEGKRSHYGLDRYLEERAVRIEYRGIRVTNYHRPMSTYMRALLRSGLQLAYFDEPAPVQGASAASARNYSRVPWFLVMEWTKPVERHRSVKEL